MLYTGNTSRCRLIYHPNPSMDCGFTVICAFTDCITLGTGTAMIGVILLYPCTKIMRLNIVTVACLALLIVTARVQIQIRLTIVVVGMADRHGAACGFGAAGDCDSCRALCCLNGYLAGVVNCCNIRLVACPTQDTICVDRLLHSGERNGVADVQIYLLRGNGDAGKRNRRRRGHGDIKEGFLRKRFVFVAVILDGNQLQLGFPRCGMSRFRLDLAVLQFNVIILRQMRKAGAAGLDNAPFQMIAAVLGQQLRKIVGSSAASFTLRVISSYV